MRQRMHYVRNQEKYEKLYSTLRGRDKAYVRTTHVIVVESDLPLAKIPPNCELKRTQGGGIYEIIFDRKLSLEELSDYADSVEAISYIY